MPGVVAKLYPQKNNNDFRYLQCVIHPSLQVTQGKACAGAHRADKLPAIQADRGQLPVIKAETEKSNLVRQRTEKNTLTGKGYP
jgi:hypothetical protein